MLREVILVIQQAGYLPLLGFGVSISLTEGLYIPTFIASVIADIASIRWTDSVWMKKRAAFHQDTSPISIYECHIGSWMRHPHAEQEDGFYNYRYWAIR